MSGIKQPIVDVLTKLAAVPAVKYVRIWNNQVDSLNVGELYDFPKPALFLETINDVQFQQLGGAFQSADVGFRIHIIHEYYDAQDGTFEQDLPVFDIRDSIKAMLSMYEPTACGPLVQVAETQDYNHTNIYHYMMDFLCNFTDSKGSPEDPNSGKFVIKEPPIALDLTVNTVDNIDGQQNEPYRTFIIPQ